MAPRALLWRHLRWAGLAAADQLRKAAESQHWVAAAAQLRKAAAVQRWEAAASQLRAAAVAQLQEGAAAQRRQAAAAQGLAALGIVLPCRKQALCVSV